MDVHGLTIVYHRRSGCIKIIEVHGLPIVYHGWPGWIKIMEVHNDNSCSWPAYSLSWMASMDKDNNC